MESISDVFYGYIQSNNYLYKVGFSLTVKSLLSILSFIIIDYFTNDLLLAMIFVTIMNIIMLVFYDYRNFNNLAMGKLKLDFSKTTSILKGTFSVFVFSFLQTYLLNEQKYVLTYFVENDMQTIFGILIMPATVLSMMCNYLIMPFINKFSYYYSTRDIKKFVKLSVIINSVLLLLGLIVVGVTYLIGIPVLNFIFKISLDNYKSLLIIILLSSVIYAISTVLSNLLTIMRHNTSQSVLYFIISVVGTVLSYFFIKNNGIYGATYSYLLNFALLLLFISVLFIYFIKEVKYEKRSK
jgi:O-antigen/teichoic acid export membrane protein